MNKIPNRQAICEVLMKHAETDKDIVVLCSDSRGSASLTPFANAYPEPPEAMSRRRLTVHTPTPM